ncbi:MAG TPA: hypothetical protein VNO52_16720, partial [Methylomirabilota bacterium]|nr:hypothetical protein [Methylomirabilota bacterium]
RLEQRRLTFINRTETKARALAEHCGGSALPWEALSSELAVSDVIIAATACPRPILTRQRLQSALRGRRGAPPLLIDAGVPRNIEAGSPFPVHDIDAIRERQETALVRRRAAVPAVERLIEEALAEWERWRAARPIEAALKSLFTHADPLLRAADAAGADPALGRSLRRLLGQHARQLRAGPFGVSSASGCIS